MTRSFLISAIALLLVITGTNAYIAYRLDKVEHDGLLDVETEERNVTDNLAIIAKRVACTNERLSIIQDDISKIESHTSSVATHLPEPLTPLPPKFSTVASCLGAD
jgi:hypothetical protein